MHFFPGKKKKRKRKDPFHVIEEILLKILPISRAKRLGVGIIRYKTITGYGRVMAIYADAGASSPIRKFRPSR